LLNYIRKAGLSQSTQHPVLVKSICGVRISWRNLWKPSPCALVLCLSMQSQCVRRLVHNFCGKNVENVFESDLQRASLRDG